MAQQHHANLRHPIHDNDLLKMKRPRIKIDENIPFIKGRLDSVADVEYLSQDLFTNDIAKDADALIVRTRTACNENLLKDSPVSLVVTATIGTDHIDSDYCRSKGITVMNSPGCNAPGVAQYVWSSILRLGFRPGKDKLGIVGYGNVGSIVADWGELTGTEVLVSDPPKSLEAIREGKEWISKNRMSEGSIREASLKEILEECDVVTLHTPLTRHGENATFHLIGKEELKLMKPGAILVNASRGPVVDTQALKEAIKKKKIKAVIDTWEGEPMIDKELLALTSIATPHIAGYSRQGKERATRMAIEAVNHIFEIGGDISGLTGNYQPPATITEKEIEASYNPFDDDRALRTNPDSFEQLRHDYQYREEPATDNEANPQ